MGAGVSCLESCFGCGFRFGTVEGRGGCEGWVDVEVTGVAQGAQDRGAHLLVMGRAVSWRDEEEGDGVGGQKQKRGERDRGERENRK